MDPKRRTLLRVVLPRGRSDEDIATSKETAILVEDLMGRKPEKRFQFIQSRAEFAGELDV